MEPVHGRRHGFLAGFPFEGDGLVYSDPPCSGPPYLRAARRSRRRYRHGCAEADHAALPGPLRSLPCQAMVPGHPSALCDGMLRDRRRAALPVTAQGRVRTEAVRFSFTPDRMHRAGRRRIRRKAARRAEGCRKMPPGERLAAVPAIMAVEAERRRR